MKKNGEKGQILKKVVISIIVAAMILPTIATLVYAIIG